MIALFNSPQLPVKRFVYRHGDAVFPAKFCHCEAEHFNFGFTFCQYILAHGSEARWVQDGHRINPAFYIFFAKVDALGVGNGNYFPHGGID